MSFYVDQYYHFPGGGYGYIPVYDEDAPNSYFISATLEQEMNRAAVFTFSIASGHPSYSSITLFKTDIRVMQDNDYIFMGVVTDEEVDLNGVKTYTCYDYLGILDYSVQNPGTFTGTPTNVLTTIIQAANLQTDFVITIGTITVDAASVSVTSDYDTTLKLINDLVEQYGGYLRLRRNGFHGVYLDWLKDSPRICKQVIKRGSNILDFNKSTLTDEFATMLIPIGANGLTIASVNSGNVFLQSANASTYGRKWMKVSFDDITDANVLKTAGQNYLSQIDSPIVSIEVSACDLSYAFSDIQTIRLLDRVYLTSPIHGLNNEIYMVTKLYTDICNPESSRITLNKNMRLPISRSVANLQNK